MRWWWRVLVAVTLAGATLLGGGPAYAHAELVSSDPADGATLDTPPRQVVLTFSGDLRADVSRVAVTLDGRSVTLIGPVRITGRKATVPLSGDAGRYRVAYRVVATDGHRIDGEIRFTVTVAPPSSPTAGSPGNDGNGAVAEAAPTPSRAGNGRDQRLNAPWLLAGLGAVLVLGVVAYVLSIGRHRGEDDTGSGRTSS